MGIDWKAVGESFGASLADGVKRVGLGDKVRAHYVAKFGVCRVCKEPLGGASPDHVCEECHASEVLAHGLGGNGSADA